MDSHLAPHDLSPHDLSPHDFSPDLTPYHLPPSMALAVAAEHRAFDGYLDRARALQAAGDRDGLRTLADALRDRIRAARATIGGWVNRVLDGVLPGLAEVYDAAWPPPLAGSVLDPAFVAETLSAPWPTPRRAALCIRLAVQASTDPAHLPAFTAIAEVVLSAPDSPARDRAITLLIGTPFGHVERPTVIRLLTELHARGRLDAAAVLRAHRADHRLGADLDDSPAGQAIRAHLDDILWRATADGTTTGVPDGYRPHGLRFVWRGLERLEVAGDHVPSVLVHMCRAVLTADEVAELGDELVTRPRAMREAGFAHRFAAGDSELLLPAFDLTDATKLHALMRSAVTATPPAGEDERHRVAARPVRVDRVRVDVAAVRSALDGLAPAQARELLALSGDPVIAELFGAVAGIDASAVRRRFAGHALTGIAAYGLLPLGPGEQITDRYRALRASAARGATFVTDRRISHTAAVELALDHLAQTAGYADVDELELDMEARLGASGPTSWACGDYTIRLDLASADLRIARGERELVTVPAAVRRSPEYTDARTAQEALRAQRRRMRHGLIERLIATGAPIDTARLARHLETPAGARLLPDLLWRTAGGGTGWLDGAAHLIGIDNQRHPATGPLHAVHPVELAAAELAAWQRDAARRRVVAPVKQLHREVYTPTPAERAGTGSARFAGQVVAGNVAARLLGDRGWQVDHSGSAPITRRWDAIEVTLHADHRGPIGDGDLTLETITFTRNGRPLTGAGVPPIVWSEALRDVALVVGVAGRRVDSTTAALYERAAVLAPRVRALGLDRVEVEAHEAVVHGEHATYRVHLGSGTVRVGDGYLTGSIGATIGWAYGDEDPLAGAILETIRTLAHDERISDPALLQEVTRLIQPA